MPFNNDPAPNKKNTDAFRRLEEALFQKAYTVVAPLTCTAYVTEEPVSFENKTTGREMRISVGDKWAENVFDCAWFHMEGEIPERYQASPVVFLINCGGEGLIYTKNGEARQSITCYASEYDYSLGKPEKKVVLNRGLSEKRKVDFWIDGAANDLFGIMQGESRFALMSIAVENPTVRSLYYDVQVLTYIYEYAENSDFTDRIYEALAALPSAAVINENNAAVYRDALAPLLAEKNDDGAMTYTGIGHAHLDLAWEWPIRESKRKGARTFATQLMNMERYPDYIFGASQAQLYDWMKQEYPEIYAKVKEAAADGSQWEVQGATWVEPDSNLISGESLIRQFYYGKKFFLEEFGQDMQIFWVPDSFGYSACIPQVMKQAEVPYFLTQKMSWNTITEFPYHTFFWEGLDGTKVFAHMLPESTYNSPVRPDRMISGEKNYKERNISDEAGMLFGIGDGGAGPGFEHIERMHRLADIKQVPKVKPGKMLDLFNRLDASGKPWPTYSGELYLQRHQGTYTTQVKNKAMNRRSEILLRNYEMLAAAAQAQNIALPVSMEEVEKIWKEVLLYQFHDILPGSSISRVYEETSPRYDLIAETLTDGIQKLADALADGIGFFNPTSYGCRHTYKKAGKWYTIDLPAMSMTSEKKAAEITEFKAFAGAVVSGETAAEKDDAVAVCAAESFIENDCVKVIFKDGVIVSLVDKKSGREFVPENAPMNVFSQYTDIGDCWDIRPEQYQDTRRDAKCVRFETMADGPEAAAKATYLIGNIYINETFRITDGSPAVMISIDMDVRQKNAMLRVAFPTNLQADEASFNVQFGHLKRTMLERNDEEFAQYEVCGQKFVDISEEALGLSVINDCKYGYRCKYGVIDIDLVRAPKHGPGDHVDQGPQSVKLVLLPHEGALSQETYKAAYLLNNPVMEVEGKGAGKLPAFTSRNENIVVESVKIPDDGCGVILRCYNASEVPQKFAICLEGMKAAELVNIPEHHVGDMEEELELKPFELVNVRFV